ncbi:MAG: M17 family peptidase N-terminal domain-containing protein [Candidatus Acidiferrales bacterium]
MQISRVLSFPLLLAVLSIPQLLSSPPSQCQADRVASLPNIGALHARSTAIPVQVLVQSPAETTTELQIICVFQSAPENTLHGSLVEINQKLQGLLEQIRNPALFRGDLGETLLITPSTGNLAAKNLLLIGLGDSETFTPQRMELVGTIAYRESERLTIRPPYFASTILDGGLARYKTGEISQAFMTGFLRAARTERVLVGVGASAQEIVQNLTFLAGAAHASDTKQGIEAALATNGKQ